MPRVRLPRIVFLRNAGPGIALVVLLASAGAATAQPGAIVHPMESELEALHRAGEYSRAVDLIRPALERTPDDHYLLCKIADNLTDWARISPKKE